MLREWTVGVPVRTFTYDSAGRMTEATVFTLTTRFTYNGDGARRVVEVVGHGTTTYTVDYAAGYRILAETMPTSTVTYLYGHGCLGEFKDDEWLYYLNDATGYVRQGADEGGQVTSNWLFDPDGTVLEGPQGPVSHLICGGVYDWSTGLVFKGGRYFDPSLGIWLALTPLMVLQSWRGRKRKRRGMPWYVVAVVVMVMGVGGMLAGCGEVDGDGTNTPTPGPTACAIPPTPTVPPGTPTPPPTEILTPFEAPLGANAVFVDPLPGGSHPTHPQAQTWTDSDKKEVEAVLTDVINNKFGGSTGFGSLDAALTAFGVSTDNPIRLVREPIHESEDNAVRAAAARPTLYIYDSWFDLDTSEQAGTLGHEMTHYWDQASDTDLKVEMEGWINWGKEATDHAARYPGTGEDLAEAVRVYFWWDDFDEDRRWTDDKGAGLVTAMKIYGSKGPDDFWVKPGEEKPYLPAYKGDDGAIRVQDRYDWLQLQFTGTWLTP